MLPDRAFVEFFERIPLALLVRALETEAFVAVNRAFESLTGYDRAEIVGRKPEEIGIFHPMPHHHHTNVVRVVTEGELIDQTGAIRCKDGGILEVVFSTSRVYAAGELYVVSVLRARSEVSSLADPGGPAESDS